MLVNVLPLLPSWVLLLVVSVLVGVGGSILITLLVDKLTKIWVTFGINGGVVDQLSTYVLSRVFCSASSVLT